MAPNRNGFTLLEALVVLAIVSVLAVIALPSLGKWRQQAAFKDASRHAASALREARSLAITERWEYRVNFDIDESRYQILRGDRANGSTSWDVVTTPWTSFPIGVAILSGENCLSSNDTSLKFMSDGTSNCFGSSCWEANRFLCIMEGSAKKFRVGVSSPATGHIEVLRWDGAWKR